MVNRDCSIRMSSVRFNKKVKAFAVERSLVQGLHSRLQQRFYPSYSFEAATQGEAGNPSSSGIRNLTQKRGLRRGVLTDNQMSKTVTWFNKYSIPVRVLCDRAALREYAVAHKQTLPACAYKQFTTGLSAPTIKIWQCLRMQQLRPVATQVPVGVKEWRLGTAVDIETHNERGEMVLIEIKTGYDTYYHKHTSTPLQHLKGGINDSPANQHQLQLLVTCELYRQTKQLAAHVHGVVFRVHALGIDAIPLQSWTIQQRKTILQHVA